MKHAIIAIALITALFTGGCCKEGLDGKATINATIQHHDSLIRGATVFVKFNAKEQPASKSEYDATYQLGPGESTLRIDGLKCGHYFFYAEGYDNNIMQNVKGGVPFSIAYADRKDEIEIIIPVTED